VKNARELFRGLHPSILARSQGDVGMFTEDGGLELPYLTDFGYPERFAGAEGITGFTAFSPRHLSRSSSGESQDPHRDAGPGIRRIRFTAVSTKTGRKVHQLFLAGWWPRTARSSWFARP